MELSNAFLAKIRNIANAICLFKRMINQGGTKTMILKQIAKAINRHPEPFSTFSKTTWQIMDDIATSE